MDIPLKLHLNFSSYDPLAVLAFCGFDYNHMIYRFLSRNIFAKSKIAVGSIGGFRVLCGLLDESSLSEFIKEDSSINKVNKTAYNTS